MKINFGACSILLFWDDYRKVLFLFSIDSLESISYSDWVLRLVDIEVYFKEL